MAINKIASPLSDSPSVFAAPVVNQLLALAIDCNHGARVSGGYIKKGSLWNIGGQMFIADSDTAISGTRSASTVAIKFSVSGNMATALYVDSTNSAVWNGSYQGYYDTSGNMYFYECSAGSYTLESYSASYAVGPGTITEMSPYKVIKTGCYRIKTTVSRYSNQCGLYVNGILMYPFTEGVTIIQDLFLECGDVVIATMKHVGEGPLTIDIDTTVRIQSDYCGFSL
jgi:hypothetical protein